MRTARKRAAGFGGVADESGRMFRSIAEALPHIEHFDLVLMDCQMPVMHGVEATRLIRQLASESARVPIVAMTANAQHGDRLACLAAGMNDYISKPASLADFRSVIERWLPNGVKLGSDR